MICIFYKVIYKYKIDFLLDSLPTIVIQNQKLINMKNMSILISLGKARITSVGRRWEEKKIALLTYEIIVI